MRNINARVILELADILADLGHPQCMVARAMRLADKMRRKPKPGADQMTRRRSKTLLRTAMLGYATVALAVASSAHAGEQTDVKLVMKNGTAEVIEVDKDMSIERVWSEAMAEARLHRTELVMVVFANTYGQKTAH